MAQRVFISFSHDEIQVVAATCLHGNVHVKRAYRLSDEEFDEFLRLDSTESYVVSVNIEELFQEIIHLPPAKEKYLDQLVRGEIRKLHPDLENYTVFYETFADTLYEGKFFKKIVCFIYSVNDIAPVISRFTRFGKRISQLYSSSYVLSRLVDSSSAATFDPLLCIALGKERKTVFLLEQNRLYFVRQIQSHTSGIDELDVHSINMTIDHCFQTLRLKPRYAVCLGAEEVIRDSAEGIMLPLQSQISCKAIAVNTDLLWEYATPIASTLCRTTPQKGNILPKGYQAQSFAMDLLRSGTWFLACLCLLAAFGSAVKAYSLAGLRQNIMVQRTALNGVDLAMEEYSRVSVEFSKAEPMIAAINQATAQAHQQTALVALGCLSSSGIHPTSLIMKPKDGTELAIEVKGELKGDNFTELQARYERLIANIKVTGKLDIVVRKMDPAARSFELELIYKGQPNGPA